MQSIQTLRVGLVGSGFIAGFHLRAFVGVRNVQIVGVFSPTRENREALAKQADELGLGPCMAYRSLEEMISSRGVDAVWILTPNDTRLEVMRTIHRLVVNDPTLLRAVACEKPLGRTVAEAKEMVRLVEEAGLLHGYLENQLFSTAVARGKEIIWRRAVALSGRPYLARAAEEHSGPHEPWFWRGAQQGGGVLLDMMCHSIEVARFLLTNPDEGRDSLTVRSASATTATLKWARPFYAKRLRDAMGPTVDFERTPVEDFARATLMLEDNEGTTLMIEATTSWAYVGPGLRIQLELLGPEYSMEFSSLNTGLKVFLSRQVAGAEGEDLVEKQNAEQGLMPVLEDEAGIYGYTEENRHMVGAFREGRAPIETFHDGLAVVSILMALYRSAELGRTVDFIKEADALEEFIPQVAVGD